MAITLNDLMLARLQATSPLNDGEILSTGKAFCGFKPKEAAEEALERR